jgi:hypothetical protein
VALLGSIQFCYVLMQHFFPHLATNAGGLSNVNGGNSDTDSKNFRVKVC